MFPMSWCKLYIQYKLNIKKKNEEDDEITSPKFVIQSQIFG